MVDNDELMKLAREGIDRKKKVPFITTPQEEHDLIMRDEYKQESARIEGREKARRERDMAPDKLFNIEKKKSEKTRKFNWGGKESKKDKAKRRMGEIKTFFKENATQKSKYVKKKYIDFKTAREENKLKDFTKMKKELEEERIKAEYKELKNAKWRGRIATAQKIERFTRPKRKATRGKGSKRSSKRSHFKGTKGVRGFGSLTTKRSHFGKTVRPGRIRRTSLGTGGKARRVKRRFL